MLFGRIQRNIGKIFRITGAKRSRSGGRIASFSVIWRGGLRSIPV